MLKEAVIQALKELKRPATYITIYEYIVEKRLYIFYKAKEPEKSVLATLRSLYKSKKYPIKRFLSKDRIYLYSYDFGSKND